MKTFSPSQVHSLVHIPPPRQRKPSQMLCSFKTNALVQRLHWGNSSWHTDPNPGPSAVRQQSWPFFHYAAQKRRNKRNFIQICTRLIMHHGINTVCLIYFFIFHEDWSITFGEIEKKYRKTACTVKESFFFFNSTNPDLHQNKLGFFLTPAFHQVFCINQFRAFWIILLKIKQMALKQHFVIFSAP